MNSHDLANRHAQQLEERLRALQRRRSAAQGDLAAARAEHAAAVRADIEAAQQQRQQVAGLARLVTAACDAQLSSHRQTALAANQSTRRHAAALDEKASRLRLSSAPVSSPQLRRAAAVEEPPRRMHRAVSSVGDDDDDEVPPTQPASGRRGIVDELRWQERRYTAADGSSRWPENTSAVHTPTPTSLRAGRSERQSSPVVISDHAANGGEEAEAPASPTAGPQSLPRATSSLPRDGSPGSVVSSGSGAGEGSPGRATHRQFSAPAAGMADVARASADRAAVLTVAELFADIIDDPSLDAAHLDTLARVIASHSTSRGPHPPPSRSSTEFLVADARVGQPSFTGIDALAGSPSGRTLRSARFDGVVDELVADDVLAAAAKAAANPDVHRDTDDAQLLPGPEEVLRAGTGAGADDDEGDIERFLALHAPRLARSRGEPQLDPARRLGTGGLPNTFPKRAEFSLDGGNGAAHEL